jgi:uncharacterized DUF497 family protein
VSFEWDRANESHAARHRVTREEFEQAINNDPVLVAEYKIRREWRTHVVGITDRGRLLELVYTIRRGSIREVTAYPLKRSRREFYRGHFAK